MYLLTLESIGKRSNVTFRASCSHQDNSYVPLIFSLDIETVSTTFKEKKTYKDTSRFQSKSLEMVRAYHDILESIPEVSDVSLKDY